MAVLQSGNGSVSGTERSSASPRAGQAGRRRVAGVAAWVFVAAFVAASTSWVIHHYAGHPERVGPDLRAHYESCLSVGEGRFFENAGEGGSTFRVHTPVILVLLLPIFFCFPSPYTLIIASNIALVLTAWPLYWIVRTRAGEWSALALCAAFLLAPTSTSPIVLLEFTPLKFAPLGIALCLLAFEQERFGRFALLFRVSLAVREDVPLHWRPSACWPGSGGWTGAGFSSSYWPASAGPSLQCWWSFPPFEEKRSLLFNFSIPRVSWPSPAVPPCTACGT